MRESMLIYLLVKIYCETLVVKQTYMPAIMK